uniref:Uncharacterized protein n=1 Tax=Arundo donax TaxID=35708 RepID=A0A0A9ERS0_ARUDO
MYCLVPPGQVDWFFAFCCTILCYCTKKMQINFTSYPIDELIVPLLLSLQKETWK